MAITNDRHIRTRHDEATAALVHGLRCVHLAPAGRAATRWDFARLLLSHWEAVERLAGETGPAWLALSGHGTRRLPYRPGDPPRLPPARG